MIADLAKLEKTETRKLKTRLQGHGSLKELSQKTGIPADTLRRISKNGHGKNDYIRAIREKVLG